MQTRAAFGNRAKGLARLERPEMVLRFHMTLAHEHFKRVWILLLVVASPSNLVAYEYNHVSQNWAIIP